MNTSSSFAGITGRRGMKTKPKKLKVGKLAQVGEMPMMKGKKGMPFMAKKGKRKG